MRKDRFLQPVDAIKIVSRASGPRTLLTEEAIEAGRRRVAAGEDPQAVALDLAIKEVALKEALGADDES